jgi:DNA-binding transcriptional LysR family regulator
MEFRRGHLLYFVTVAEEGQITRAARRLHIAQPALSLAIAQLESDLGVALLERHSRGVSLTPAGEQFLVKARAAVEAWSEALVTARSLAREHAGAIEFGFVGSPPGIDSPASLEAFSLAHPHIDIRFRELPFPCSSPTAWLAEVDVAVCHRPPADENLWTLTLRDEPRVVLASERHRLAGSERLSVADVLDETFVGLDSSVDPAWAGFWSLDDHRGAPAPNVTPDRAASAQDVIASLAVRPAITTVPASVGRLVRNLVDSLAVIELADAAEARIMLVGREDRRTPHVDALRSFAATAPPPDPR